MPSKHHVIITGTGRAGTTFLVELLTHLGLDTGFSVDNMANKKHQEARAGLEHDLRKNDCPFVVKSPHFCDYAKEIIRRDDIEIKHVFVPIRNLHAASESRRYVSKMSAKKLPLVKKLKHMIKPKVFAGGLWHTKSSKPEKQEEVLLSQIYKLVFALSDTSIPVTLMRYPRITEDSKYLYKKLGPMLGNINLESFCTAFDKVVRPELVHKFNTEDCYHALGQHKHKKGIKSTFAPCLSPDISHVRDVH